MLNRLRQFFGSERPPELEIEEKGPGDLILRVGDTELPVKLSYPDYSEKVQQQRADTPSWNDLNQRIIEGVKSGNWHSVKMAHFQQARMIFDRGGDHQALAAETRRDELRYHQGFDFVEKLVVKAQDDCQNCEALDGQEYTIAEALELMPIPCRSCQNEADENPHGGWCRCYYQPI